MSTYSTLDYLSAYKPSASEMAGARPLTFSTASAGFLALGYENEATYSESGSGALLRDLFRVTLTEGATYFIYSSSYFDPFILSLHDAQGSFIAVDSGNSYGNDTISYIAPYSGTYYINASWDQGSASSNKFVYLSIQEDIDTITTTVKFNNSPTGNASISGNIKQNEILTASNSLSDIDGVGAITYNWRVSSDNKTWTKLTSGSTVKLTEAEVGKYLLVNASYIDGKGNSESISSLATKVVVNVNDNPVGSVSINGTTKSGQILTASNNLTDADGLGNISYTWQTSNDGLTWSNLSNGSTLTITNNLVGNYIRVNATYIDGHGTSELVSSIKTDAIKPLAQQTNTTSHSLSIIVDKGILDINPVLLKGLTESITSTDGVITARSLIYAGTSFDYNQIDPLIMTVTRDDEFTAEFTKEINDYLKTEANIAYKVAVGLVGAANIDGIIIGVAGADGTYVS